MYTPAANRVTDRTALQNFIRENPLCALVSMTAQGIVATHLPVVLHEAGEGFGVLRGHVARANTHWSQLAANTHSLAIFTGPHHYISASWYPGKSQHGKEVPTWNYVAVHAHGHLRVMEDPDWLMEHLITLTDQSEMGATAPWRVADAPRKFIAHQLRGIVGLELEVERVEGKWKVSQNRNDEDASAVADALHCLGTPAGEAMHQLVVNRRPHPSG